MPTIGPSGNAYHLGFRRGPERPGKWRFQLIPRGAVDRSRMRSLSKYRTVQPPFDQGAEGSCTANSGILVAMMCAAIGAQQVPLLSREWMYYWERSILGTLPADSGADVIDEYDVDSNQQYGDIADSVWPYDANPRTQPPAAASSAQKYKTVAAYQPIAAGQDSTIDGILTALDNVQPVPIGLLWNDAFTAAYEHGAPITPSMMPAVPDEGHALTIIGYGPPANQYPLGIFVAQGSWGENSPAEIQLWPDAKRGDHYIDGRLLVARVAGQVIVSDVYAAVPMQAPATITLQVTPPTNATVGQPSAWSVQPVGAPPGTQLSYVWAFSDGGAAGGQNAVYTPRAAGNIGWTCTAANPANGGIWRASGSITVAPGPSPSPSGVTQAQIDASQQALIAQLNQYVRQYPQAAAFYAYASKIVQYDQQSVLDPMFAGHAGNPVTEFPHPESV